MRLRAPRCQGAERDRIAQRLGWRDCVLPGPTRRPAHGVYGAGLQLQSQCRAPVIAMSRVRPQAHSARAVQRYADDSIEIRHVAMPTQLRADAIFGNHCMVELPGRNATPLGNPFAKRKEERWDRARGQQFVVAKIVASTKARDAPLRGPLFIVCLFEGQSPNRFEQRPFLGSTEKILSVDEALWQNVFEQLCLGHRPTYNGLGAVKAGYSRAVCMPGSRGYVTCSPQLL